MQSYLFPSLPSGPLIIHGLIGRIEESKLDLPTHSGRFTPREVVAHLADWEPILLQRMKQTVERPGSTIIGIDEGQMAVDQKYSESNWREQAIRFMELRSETTAWLKQRKPEDFDLAVTHNERGVQTLYDQANALLGHDLYHIEQLFAVLD